MAKRRRVTLDPIAADALDQLEAEMGPQGWRASRSDIASALIFYANAPTVVGVTRAFNMHRAKAEQTAGDA